MISLQALKLVLNKRICMSDDEPADVGINKLRPYSPFTSKSSLRNPIKIRVKRNKFTPCKVKYGIKVVKSMKDYPSISRKKVF